MNKENSAVTYRRKTYQELGFTDDFMFRKVLINNEELCKELIELLLDVKVGHIAYKDQEHSITATPDAKSVRLDVYLDDEDGRVFDLEMQTANTIPLPKRTRYYQSMIDIDHLASGAAYTDLPESYIVFICTFDPFGRGLHKYDFRERCLQDDSLELGDETTKVFINAKSRSGDMSGDMRAFLDYLCGEEASSSLTRNIDASITLAKAYKPWEAEYMQFNEIIDLARADARREGREEGREEGRAEGREEGRAEGREEGRAEQAFADIDRIVASGKLNAEEACAILGVDREEYSKRLNEGHCL